ncbi:MAG TPA: hypothetical protein VFH56_11035 [Acidimicrobiales bacterium]|nr:hypothetical protein [Acidimicrobiales bacterium]
MSNCRWVASDQQRVLPGRHLDGCPEDGCDGCQPCAEPHCSVCRRAHADGACAECLAESRDELNTIRRICGVLPAEATRRGINGEAMMLNGPSANAEAWGNRHMSALRGRLCKCATRGQVCPAYFDRMCPDAAAYLEDARDEAHPLWVLGGWENLWRDVLDQPSGLKQTIERAADYIDRHMHEMAQREEPDFAQFATEIRGCRAHLEAVIHDERQGDAANVGCFECGGRLERKLTERNGFEDVWTCTRCRRRYTYAEYNFALRAHLEAARNAS